MKNRLSIFLDPHSCRFLNLIVPGVQVEVV